MPPSEVMYDNNTITMQEIRKNPVGFLRQINAGKTLVVTYHSQPFVTVTSADKPTSRDPKSTKRLLEQAKLARQAVKSPLTSDKSYKETYAEDMAKKYGIS